MEIRKRRFKRYLLALLFLMLFLYIYRANAHTEMDDLVPEDIPCDYELLKTVDVLYVIPLFDNKSIANESEWCKSILALNKTIGIHGVRHTKNEFAYERSEEYMSEGIDSFEKCFGYKPLFFKAPNLALDIDNRNFLKKEGFNIQGYPNQILHKVYHCGASGLLSQKFQKWF